MAAPVYVTLNIQQSGTTPIAFAQITLPVSGTPTIMNAQGGFLLDPSNQIPATVDANGLHVVPSVGAPNSSGPISNTSIASGASATLTSSVPVTSGKTGTLQHAVFASTLPILWTIQTVNNAGTPTNQTQFITDAYRTFDFRAAMQGAISTVQSTGSNCVFQATAVNLSTNQSVNAAAYCTFFWAEN